VVTFMNPNPYPPGPNDRTVHSARSAPQPVAGPDPSPFAVHGDPTQRNQSAKPDVERNRRRVMWIRPTDLPTQLVGSRRILAGIDLHAALVEKLWRQPAKGMEALRRRSDRSDEPPGLDAPAEPRPRAPQRPSVDGVNEP
jgi:hypothetical protein